MDGDTGEVVVVLEFDGRKDNEYEWYDVSVCYE